MNRNAWLLVELQQTAANGAMVFVHWMGWQLPEALFLSTVVVVHTNAVLLDVRLNDFVKFEADPDDVVY